MIYSINKRHRLIRRAKRHLERVFAITIDLNSSAPYSEVLEILFHIEELFPVEVKRPHGHGL